MNWQAAAVIGTLAIVAATLLYLPFFIWFRWRGSKPKLGKATTHVTGAGLCLYGITVVALLTGLAVGTLLPNSWFGAQVQTLFGGFGFFSAVSMVASALERILVKRGFVFVVRKPAVTAEISSETGHSETPARKS